jgi:hypothetical protein
MTPEQEARELLTNMACTCADDSDLRATCFHPAVVEYYTHLIASLGHVPASAMMGNRQIIAQWEKEQGEDQRHDKAEDALITQSGVVVLFRFNANIPPDKKLELSETIKAVLAANPTADLKPFQQSLGIQIVNVQYPPQLQPKVIKGFNG